MQKKINILGTRGIPASHGGFESFAEKLAPYLVEHGWEVVVYCQESGNQPISEDVWNGVRLIKIAVNNEGPLGSFIFDWKSTCHAAKAGGLALTLGYNTAVFCFVHRLKGIKNLINMDGIEWKREKWSMPMKAWFYINEWAGSMLGNHLIADHPQIGKHLQRNAKAEKITVIPYGSDRVEDADPKIIEAYDLLPNNYAIIIARPEPENSIIEIVSAFSQKPRGYKLVVLGKYDQEVKYQRETTQVASEEVIFLGAIYDQDIVKALRFHSVLYVHGHRVGGTNPSLVEALGAGNPVLAHDNKFNRWVAGEDQFYFSNEAECAEKFDKLLNNDKDFDHEKNASIKQHQTKFTWEKVLSEYRELFEKWVEK